MLQASIAAPTDPAGPSDSPRLAVVVPIFRHSVLLSEAIESALAQQANFAIRLVLVNDGCPHRETDLVCRSYAIAHPDRVTYLRKPNGGLSDARNHGIRHALRAWPSVEAIYMLDADNRLRPDAMATAMAELDRHPEAGWIYPDIDMFGMPWAGDYGGPYSLLVHTAMNICEAGSLIRRAVFEAGAFFDTSFRSGFEDWDFFLSAADAGFRGRHCANFGFLYRKRAESMLADSEREGEAIGSVMRKKHARLFQPRRLLELEQHEAPRFAIILADRAEVIVTTDPDHPEARLLDTDSFARDWWRTQTDNSQHHAPPLIVMTDSGTIELLRSAGVLHWALWMLERGLHDKPFSAMQIQPRPGQRIGWEDVFPTGSSAVDAAMVMLRPGLLGEIMRDSSLDWTTGIAADPCTLPCAALRLSLPEDLFAHLATPHAAAAHDVVAFAARLRGAPWRAAPARRWDWRDQGIAWRARTHEIVRSPSRADAAFPRVGRPGRDVGFALPLVEFGGVERVALNIARAMRRAGWRPHLFVLDARDCLFTPEWREVFDSITFLADPNFTTWGGASSDYLGTAVPDWARYGDQRNATAMLAWLDLVVTFHGGAISGVMGPLKRLGVRTAISLHVHDLTPFGRPVGNAQLGLAFEHAYDMFLPCSLQMADWCHAMGVPAEKILPIPNAPAFDLPPAARLRIPDRRRTRLPGAPLRAVYLGRLDPQKGILRLATIIEAAARRGIAVEWRIAGTAVMGGTPLPPVIANRLEPVLTTPEQLADALEWADLFVLPSYYEGLPLTILEAMRSGVVPMATDSGAVTEVIDHWRNGIVLGQTNPERDALDALERLARDRDLLRRLSERAVEDMKDRDWDHAIAPMLERSAALLEPPARADEEVLP